MDDDPPGTTYVFVGTRQAFDEFCREHPGEHVIHASNPADVLGLRGPAYVVLGFGHEHVNDGTLSHIKASVAIANMRRRTP